MRLRHLVALFSALTLTVGATTALAGGGNSANAKSCQKNGWKSLYRSDGSTFANQDDCVSYSAHGGTILTSPPKSQSQLHCESFGGTYSTDPGSNQTPTPGTVVFTCNHVPQSPQTFPNLAVLHNDCGPAGGTYDSADATVDEWWYACLK